MFFSTPTKREDDGIRVPEEAADRGGGDEAREGVEVVESRENGHAAIVTSFATREKTTTPTKTREISVSKV
jgi:hypothetical protein